MSDELAAKTVLDDVREAFGLKPGENVVVYARLFAADAKRLDWLAREWEKNGCVAFATERPRQPAVCNLFTATTQHIKARGFREVIDAAIGNTGKALGASYD